MVAEYKSPALVHYGGLEALTASWYKCTSGTDAYGASVNGTLAIDVNGKIMGPNGVEYDPDACQYQPGPKPF